MSGWTKHPVSCICLGKLLICPGDRFSRHWLHKNIKREVWEHMEELFQGILRGGELFIERDLNDHVGKDISGYKMVQDAVEIK